MWIRKQKNLKGMVNFDKCSEITHFYTEKYLGKLGIEKHVKPHMTKVTCF